jgi:hypothetical protein
MTRVLTVALVVALCAYASAQIRRSVLEAAALRRSGAQLTTVIRDAAARAEMAGVVPSAEIVLTSEGTLFEQINKSAGWQNAGPAAPSMTLPRGVSVKEWTFPTNAMRAWSSGDATTTWPGRVILTDEDGHTAEVRVDGTGHVTFQRPSDAPPALAQTQAGMAGLFKDAIARTQTPVRIVVDGQGRTLMIFERSTGPDKDMRLAALFRLPPGIRVWRWESRAGATVMDVGNPRSANTLPKAIVLAGCCGLTVTVALQP